MTLRVDQTTSHAPYDLARIRRDFPILKREVAPGVPLVCLDNAATSQKPVQVIAEITRFYRDHNANILRGAHTLSVESTDMYEGREILLDHYRQPRNRGELVAATCFADGALQHDFTIEKLPGDASPVATSTPGKFDGHY